MSFCFCPAIVTILDDYISMDVTRDKLNSSENGQFRFSFLSFFFWGEGGWGGVFLVFLQFIMMMVMVMVLVGIIVGCCRNVRLTKN